MDDRIALLESRIAQLEAGAYEVRVSRLEGEILEVKGDLKKILFEIQALRLEETKRENKTLRLLVQMSLAGGGMGGAIGTGVYAVLGAMG